jgi:hypothetical protein
VSRLVPISEQATDLSDALANGPSYLAAAAERLTRELLGEGEQVSGRSC